MNKHRLNDCERFRADMATGIGALCSRGACSRIFLIPIIALLFALPAMARADAPIHQRFKELLGRRYEQSAIFWEVDLHGASAKNVGVTLAGKPVPSQVEIIEGAADAVGKARVWALADIEPWTYSDFTIVTDGSAPSPETDLRVATPSPGIQEISTTDFAVRVPAASISPEFPKPALDVPAPVLAIRGVEGKWRGHGVLESGTRVTHLDVQTSAGPVFAQSRMIYTFEGGRQYAVTARVYAHRPFVWLDESYNAGYRAAFIFDFSADWEPATVLAILGRPPKFTEMPVQIPKAAWDGAPKMNFENPASGIGEGILMALQIWTQFGDFPKLSESFGIKAAEGNDLLGAFQARTDQWDQYKFSNVDVAIRPMVDAQYLTRGMHGAAGARTHLFAEDHLISGKRQWAMFAADVARADYWAHLAYSFEGVYPLWVINQLQLTFTPPGIKLAPSNAPSKGLSGGTLSSAVNGMFGDKSFGVDGWHAFNSSFNPLRGGMSGVDQLDQFIAKGLKDGMSEADFDRAIAGVSMFCYCASNPGCYPSAEALLPWSDPQCINPYYGGRENVNFNVEVYRYYGLLGARLAKMGHPMGAVWRDKAAKCLQLQLHHYIYPESGSWQEGVNYSNYSMGLMQDLMGPFADQGIYDGYRDERFQKLLAYFPRHLAPRDPTIKDFRSIPGIGDHGFQGPGAWSAKYLPVLPHIAQINPVLAGQMAWLIDQNGPPSQRNRQNVDWAALQDAAKSIQRIAPDNSSQWIQGFGAQMRLTESDQRETYMLLRAGLASSHEHADQGSFWIWGRNHPYVGECGWGFPAGRDYGNPYKQLSAGHSRIELVGIDNWPGYGYWAEPWISAESFHDECDYAVAHCENPFHRDDDLKSADANTPPALSNQFDRQVVFVKPIKGSGDSPCFIVHDNIESNCAAIWRLHALSKTVTADGRIITIKSPFGGRCEVNMLSPADAAFTLSQTVDGKMLPPGWPKDDASDAKKNRNEEEYAFIQKGKVGAADQDLYTTTMVKMDLPSSRDVWFAMTVLDDKETAPVIHPLPGGVPGVKIDHGNGRSEIVLLNIKSFKYDDATIHFEGKAAIAWLQNGKAVRTMLLDGKEMSAGK